MGRVLDASSCGSKFLYRTSPLSGVHVHYTIVWANLQTTSTYQNNECLIDQQQSLVGSDQNQVRHLLVFCDVYSVINIDFQVTIAAAKCT